MDISKYDAVLVCDANDIILESGDPRTTHVDPIGPGVTKSVGPHWYYDDPILYASNAFGKSIAYELNGWRQGYTAKVSDFGKWVIVEVTHHNHITGRSASKTFLVVFDGGPKGTDKGGGMVLSTANKWRTISGYGQACSYIKSACAALESSTSQKL